MKELSQAIWNAIQLYFTPITYGIINIIRWFPIIWKDRDWDHYFIYKLLQQKLVFQKNYLERFSDHSSKIEECENIQTCINILQKLINEQYCVEEYNNWDIKWGNRKYLSKEDELVRSSELNSIYEEYIRQYGNDKKLLYTILKTNLENWGD